jgi:hypothetical protein
VAEPVINPTAPPVADIAPGSLAWRIQVATLAHRFFGLIHDTNTAQLINQPAEAGTAGAWPVAYFTLYLQKVGVPVGDAAALCRLLVAMEAAGLLMRAGWRADMVGLPMQGQLYISQGVQSAQIQGNLWLSEVIGPELVIESYKAVTVQVSGGEGKPSGTGLVLDRSHIITNRHVVEALVGHGVSGDIVIHPSCKPPGAEWITRQSCVHARLDVDVAVIEAELGDKEGLLALPGIAFRDPKCDDELRVFGYPYTLGFTEQPITVEHGHVVNPAAESPAVDGDPRLDVLERADRVARLGHSRFIRSPGDPEINQVGEVVAVEQDVGGFDVAVQQTNLMGGVQGQGDPLDDAHRPRRLQRPVGQHGLQIATLDQPHIHVEAAVDFAIVVNRNHMRGVQSCRRVSFAAKSPLKLLVVREMRR